MAFCIQVKSLAPPEVTDFKHVEVGGLQSKRVKTLMEKGRELTKREVKGCTTAVENDL